MSGQEFVELLKKEFVNLKKIVVGYDFHFGQHRSCTADDLRRLFDGEVFVVDEFSYQGLSVHSSLIREYLKSGRLDEANRFLGREYCVSGDVISGQGLGKTELVPTLNLKILEYLIPANGVYATRTRIGDVVYDSISFVGVRYTTDGNFSVETHILDHELNDIQGNVQLSFVKFIRGNRQFTNLQELKEQIQLDIEAAKPHLKTCRFYLRDFL